LTAITDAQQANAQIYITNEQTNRMANNYNSAGRIAGYLLTYTVDVQVWRSKHALTPLFHIMVSAPMNYNDSTILSNSDNEAQIWQYLHTLAAKQTINRIIFFTQRRSVASHESSLSDL
jgi:outer membrane lipopolysaccharide assembly protein LptE/RlpB